MFAKYRVTRSKTLWSRIKEHKPKLAFSCAKHGFSHFPTKSKTTIFFVLPFSNEHVRRQKWERGAFSLMPKRTRKGNGTNPITSHLLNREDKENKKGKERKMTSLCDPNWKKKREKRGGNAPNRSFQQHNEWNAPVRRNWESIHE